MLVQKNMWVKIILHANVRAMKAALVRHYFPRRSNFRLHASPLSLSAIFDQINADGLFRRVNYLYVATLHVLWSFYTLFQHEWQ